MTAQPPDLLVPSEASTQFLLAEHARLVQLFLDTRESAERRVTLYLTLVTAILTALVAFIQLVGLNETLETAVAAFAGLLLLGAITFQRLLERSMQGTEYLRALNRIHHYFTQRDPGLLPFLYWPPYDNLPRYDRHGVGGVETREVVAFMDSAFGAGLVGLVFYLFFQASIFIIGLSVLVVGVIIQLLHSAYERRKFDEEERLKAINIKFPMPTQVVLDNASKKGE